MRPSRAPPRVRQREIDCSPLRIGASRRASAACRRRESEPRPRRRRRLTTGCDVLDAGAAPEAACATRGGTHEAISLMRRCVRSLVMCNLQQSLELAQNLTSRLQGQSLVSFFCRPKPSMKKNRRLLVSIPPYFTIALLRPRAPRRRGMSWYHGTGYHT